jgi:CubicO group peptidase (beta-lactamase class C family)
MNLTRPLFIIILIVLTFANCASEKEKTVNNHFVYNEIYVENNPISSHIDSFFSKRFKLGAFSGAVLFSAHDTIFYKKAYGFANRKTKDSLTVNSRFQLASVSKTFTAFGIMLLEKEGRLSFQDSVRKFFPDFPYENITIHQLLVHRSGLPNYMYAADEYWKDNENRTIDNCDVLDILIGNEPTRYNHPGKRYNYNNTNYAILASIIEKASGMKYQEFMKEKLFDPIGMINTTIYDKNESEINNEKVIGYTNWRRRADNTYLNGVVGDKGIYSTVEDMNKFSRAIFENYFFTDSEMEIAYQLGNSELYDNDNYGYGWRINMLPDSSKIVYHSGWWKGFRSYFIRSLKDEKTIIVLSNNSRTGKISRNSLMDLFKIKYE